MSNSHLSYADAGVDIDAGNALVKNIAPLAKATTRPEVLTGLGGFGALFELPQGKYKQPVLVSGTDGVGTKLKLAFEMNKHDTIGIDLVAMCVNDLVVGGAEPLFFLDYYATGKLSVDQATDVVKGIANGCKLSGCALVGGETAEMPGLYHNNDYDLAGFCVGIVEKSEIINGQNLSDGDVLIAVGSSGVHSNGYSLVRKVLEITKTSLDEKFDNSTIGEVLLTPTKIYVKSILDVISKVTVKSLCHVTGGGITENLPRVMPKHTQANIHFNMNEMPTIFKWLQTSGNIATEEMLRTFNCGVGMIIAVSQNDVDLTLSTLKQHDEKAWVLGNISTTTQPEPFVQYHF